MGLQASAAMSGMKKKVVFQFIEIQITLEDRQTRTFFLYEDWQSIKTLNPGHFIFVPWTCVRGKPQEKASFPFSFKYLDQGRIAGAGPLLTWNETQGLNSGLWAWWQVPPHDAPQLPTEPSYLPRLHAFESNFFFQGSKVVISEIWIKSLLIHEPKELENPQ